MDFLQTKSIKYIWNFQIYVNSSRNLKEMGVSLKVLSGK